MKNKILILAVLLQMTSLSFSSTALAQDETQGKLKNGPSEAQKTDEIQIDLGVGASVVAVLHYLGYKFGKKPVGFKPSLMSRGLVVGMYGTFIGLGIRGAVNEQNIRNSTKKVNADKGLPGDTGSFSHDPSPQSGYMVPQPICVTHDDPACF